MGIESGLFDPPEVEINPEGQHAELDVDPELVVLLSSSFLQLKRKKQIKVKTNKFFIIIIFGIIKTLKVIFSCLKL